MFLPFIHHLKVHSDVLWLLRFHITVALTESHWKGLYLLLKVRSRYVWCNLEHKVYFFSELLLLNTMQAGQWESWTCSLWENVFGRRVCLQHRHEGSGNRKRKGNESLFPVPGRGWWQWLSTLASSTQHSRQQPSPGPTSLACKGDKAVAPVLL